MSLKTLLGAALAALVASVTAASPVLADGFPGAPVRHAPAPKRAKPRVKVVYVDRPVVVEKRVPVYVDHPVERIVEKRVEVPVEKIVEKPVYIDRPAPAPAPSPAPPPPPQPGPCHSGCDQGGEVVEKIVQVPIYVYVDRPVYVPVREAPACPDACGYDARPAPSCDVCGVSRDDRYQEQYRYDESATWSRSRYRSGGGWNPDYVEPPPLPMGYIGAQSGGRGGGYGGPGLTGGGWSGGYARGSASSSASASASASASSSIHIGGGYHGGGGGCGGCGGGKSH
ncbi:hypothetical protein [uncultured Caulobacter sp.]|uniref:hypothetical protein n=1 Tax=uncultured Caulobacter sp. TaxID=158749 RepID=UPI0026071F17|nr:hypothetical protein [uncultured Caulobacter sp.]